MSKPLTVRLECAHCGGDCSQAYAAVDHGVPYHFECLPSKRQFDPARYDARKDAHRMVKWEGPRQHIRGLGVI